MKKITFILFLLTTYIGFGQTLYVSPTGNDSNSGATSNAALETIKEAKNRVRALLIGGQTQDIHVIIENGLYELENTLSFESNDSGNNGYKVYYRGAGKKSPTISGGKKIQAVWNNYNNNGTWIKVADVSDPNFSLSDFRQLYVNGRREIRAKTEISELVSDSENYPVINASNYASFQFDNDHSNLYRPEDLEIVAQYEWRELRIPINSIFGTTWNIDSAFASIADSHINNTPPQFYWKTNIFLDDALKHVENNLSFIDEEGEWYYDKAEKKIYYYPFSNEPIASSNIIVPQLEEIIVGNNTENLIFSNLIFSHGNWIKPNGPSGYYNIQADAHMDTSGPVIPRKRVPGNISFKISNNISFVGNTFSKLGGVGLEITEGCKGFIVSSNEFNDISSNAISVGKIWDERRPNLNEVTEDVTLNWNIINNVAAEYKGSVGIFVGNISDVKIQSNYIYNLPYSGISVGFFDRKHDFSGNHIIKGNTVDDVLKTLHDGAAIYTVGGFDNLLKIVNNQIDNVNSNELLARAAIYLDQFSRNIEVRDNRIGANTIDLTSKPIDYEDTIQDLHIFGNTISNSSTIDKNITIKNNDFGAGSVWVRKKSYNPKFLQLEAFSEDGIGDTGVRFIDVNHDGLNDYIVNRYINSSTTPIKKVYLNTGSGFDTEINSTQYQVPYHIAADGHDDIGVRFVDINNDGFKDMLIHRKVSPTETVNAAYINSGNENLQNTWTPAGNYQTPYPLAENDKNTGVCFVHLDNDNLVDIVVRRHHNPNWTEDKVYLNTGDQTNNGDSWTLSTDPKYYLPYHSAANAHKDVGVRFVDINNDGRDDMLIFRKVMGTSEVVKAAYINDYDSQSSSIWVPAPNYQPPYELAENDEETGVRFIDVNHDGRKDFVVSNKTKNQVFLNTGSGWGDDDDSYPVDYNDSHIVFRDSDNLNIDQGVKIVDIDGDGFEDVIQNRKLNSATITNYSSNINPWIIKTGLETIKKNLSRNQRKIKSSFSANFVRVFPVPSSNILQVIPLYTHIEHDYSILDSSGKELLAGRFIGVSQIHLETLSTGIYFLIVNNHKKTITKRIVKQ